MAEVTRITFTTGKTLLTRIIQIAQNTPNESKLHLVIKNFPEWPEMTLNYSKWLPITPNDLKWLLKTPNDSQRPPTAPNNTHWLHVTPNDLNLWVKIDSHWLQTTPNDTKWLKEEPRLAIEDLVQMYLDREELAKLSEQKTDNILDAVEEEVQEIDPKVGGVVD